MTRRFEFNANIWDIVHIIHDNITNLYEELSSFANNHIRGENIIIDIYKISSLWFGLLDLQLVC